jgi:hypothetical protein
MTRTRLTAAMACSALLFAGAALRADVRTKERSQIKFEGMLGRMVGLFGGKAVRDGIVSTTAVSGDRKLTLNDNTGQIVDLAEEKIYELDVKKKTYTVTTFDELRQRMKEAQARAEEEARKAEKQTGETAQQEQSGKEMEVDFDLKETGQQKAIAGHDTREVVMTVTVREKGKTLDESGGIVLTSNMWLAPDVPSMKEMAEFDRRYFEKLYGPLDSAVSAEQMATVLAMYPWFKQAQERMNSEKVNMQGTALASTTTFEAVKSAEQVAAEQEQQKSSGGGGGISGMLARRMMKKDPPKPRATVFTMTHEVLSVSNEAGDLGIPVGFKQKS